MRATDNSAWMCETNSGAFGACNQNCPRDPNGQYSEANLIPTGVDFFNENSNYYADACNRLIVGNSNMYGHHPGAMVNQVYR